MVLSSFKNTCDALFTGVAVLEFRDGQLLGIAEWLAGHMPVPKAENPEVEIARRDVREATLDHRVLAGLVAVPDDTLIAPRVLHRAALRLEVLQRG
jgi:hypothetical protein